MIPLTRSKVEDTKFEAKNTNKILGQNQGQLFQEQTLSRPRTGMLEAKDQGHKRKCFPKKGLPKFFQAISKIFIIQKTLLSSSRGLGNFRGRDLRGQGHQNVSSRTPPLPSTGETDC